MLPAAEGAINFLSYMDPIATTFFFTYMADYGASITLLNSLEIKVCSERKEKERK
jgi:hypothetical protein